MATFKELEADTPARHTLMDQLRTSLLEFLKDGKSWGMPTAEGHLNDQRYRGLPATGQPSFLLVTGPWPTPFWFATATLIQKTGHLLRRCRCGRVFLRTRRQEYCTTACSQRARSKKFYNANRDELLERRHDQYAKRRRRTQPRAKVARRKRSP